MKISIYVQLEEEEEKKYINDMSYVIGEALEKVYSGEATVHLIKELTSR